MYVEFTAIHRYKHLADNPNDLDGLSALLLSVHVKSLSDVVFDLEKVTSLQSALKSFHKMKRLVDRMTSLHTVHFRWPSGAYQKQLISDKTLAFSWRQSSPKAVLRCNLVVSTPFHQSTS